jgi:hypothetical protein
MIKRLLILLATIYTCPGVSLEQLDGDITLGPEPVRKSVIMGVSFGDNTNTVIEELTRGGLTLDSRKSDEGKGLVQRVVFRGTPQQLAVANGRSELIFFQDQLIRMDFLFPPEFHNFLIVRRQLLSSVGGRFSLGRKRETMDDQLRSYLARLKEPAMTDEAKLAVNTSLVEGSTFFFYRLNDSNGEVNITYSYHAPKLFNEEIVPELRLHYSLKSGLEQVRAYRKETKSGNQVSVLPENKAG